MIIIIGNKTNNYYLSYYQIAYSPIFSKNCIYFILCFGSATCKYLDNQTTSTRAFDLKQAGFIRITLCLQHKKVVDMIDSAQPRPSQSSLRAIKKTKILPVEWALLWEGMFLQITSNNGKSTASWSSSPTGHCFYWHQLSVTFIYFEVFRSGKELTLSNLSFEIFLQLYFDLYTLIWYQISVFPVLFISLFYCRDCTQGGTLQLKGQP